jgi:DNA-binding CsgD family transcriptional regulator
MPKHKDYIRIIESAYDLNGDDQAWLDQVTRTACNCLHHNAQLTGLIIDHRYPKALDSSIHAFSSVNSPPGVLDFAIAALSQSPPSIHAIYNRNRCTTLSDFLDVPSQYHPDAAAFAQKFVQNGDTLDIVARNPDGSGVVFGTLLEKKTHQSIRTVDQWERVAAHIAAGLRLRRSLGTATGDKSDILENADAILDADGRVQHAESTAKSKNMRTALRNAAVTVDKARGKLRTEDSAEAVDLWKGLVAGQWSLVDRFDTDGKRFYVAHRNGAGVTGPNALTEREQQVVAFATIGDSNKLIAYRLGLSKSTVGTHLSSAKLKLGVATRTELIGLVTQLHRNL